MPRIIFRVDASIQIGNGHVMRCITLAEALREIGMECSFVSRSHEGNLNSVIGKRGFPMIVLPVRSASCSDGDTEGRPSDSCLAHSAWLGSRPELDARETIDSIGAKPVDWLVVDHYALDTVWETMLKPHVRRLLVIDDIADRNHNCDVLLDQNLGRTALDYKRKLSSNCVTLIGPQYALLRPEFSELREYSLERRTKPELNHLLISMGGVDKDNSTLDVLRALPECPLPPDCRISIVLGANAPSIEQVRKACLTLPWSAQVLVSVENMGELMANSDLAIGAAGTTSWERYCLGLPSIIVILAENQRESANAQSNLGCSLLIEQQIAIRTKLASLMQLAVSVSTMNSLSKFGRSVTDGRGVERVVDVIERQACEKLH